MALFHRWSELAPKCDTAKATVRLPLPGLYEYAGFFLNTLGGQSHLFRRESRVRLLGKYYSILVPDRANDASLNRYGIDIRPSVDSLLEEMKNHHQPCRKGHLSGPAHPAPGQIPSISSSDTRPQTIKESFREGRVHMAGPAVPPRIRFLFVRPALRSLALLAYLPSASFRSAVTRDTLGVCAYLPFG